MKPIAQRVVFFLEKFLLLNFCVFLVFALFSKQVVKICFGLGTFLWLLINVIKYKQKFLRGFVPANPINKPILFFIIACFLSIIFSLNPYQSQSVFFERYVFFIILFWMGVGIALTLRRNLFFLTVTFMFFNFIFALGGIHDYFYYSLINPAIVDRLWSVFGYWVPYFGLPLFLTYFIPFNFGIFAFSKRKSLKASALINLFLLSLCLFWNNTRGAWIAVILSMLLISLFKNRWFLLLTLAALSIVVSLNFLHPKFAMRQRFKAITNPCEWSNRLPLYKSAASIFLDYPVFGTGIGTFEKVLHLPKYELPKDYPVQKKWNLHAHNTYLEVASEMGIVGILTFVWIFISFFKKAVSFVVNRRKEGFQDKDGIFLGLAGVIIAILIFAFSTTIITVGLTVSSYFWFLFGLAVSFLCLSHPML